MGDQGEVATAAITVQALDHFDIDPVAEQHSGESFEVTVRAKDASGATITAYDDPVTFSVNSCSIAPATTNNFVNCVLVGQAVEITGPYTTNQTITVTGSNPAKTGTSNPFMLHDWNTSLNCHATAGLFPGGSTARRCRGPGLRCGRGSR